MKSNFTKYELNTFKNNDIILDSWEKNGYLVINQFFTNDECDNLRKRADYLIKNFDIKKFNNLSIFETNDQSHAEDRYFLESGDKIHFFFEEKAFDKNGNLNNKIELVINKIGHAMHDLDKDFYDFCHRQDLQNLSNLLGIKLPLLIQSMYIFKQPKIGGEVVCHQDSTFLYTNPESVIGFWVALEDATVNNGCLWVAKGAHKVPLRKRFKRNNNNMEMITLNDLPFEKTDTPLEVNKGSLVLLHGRLPHYSCENKSSKSRHAFTLHVIDGQYEYPKDNWLQRSNMPFKDFSNEKTINY